VPGILVIAVFVAALDCPTPIRTTMGGAPRVFLLMADGLAAEVVRVRQSRSAPGDFAGGGTRSEAARVHWTIVGYDKRRPSALERARDSPRS
jgi:hypothetical protein